MSLLLLFWGWSPGRRFVGKSFVGKSFAFKRKTRKRRQEEEYNREEARRFQEHVERSRELRAIERQAQQQKDDALRQVLSEAYDALFPVPVPVIVKQPEPYRPEWLPFNVNPAMLRDAISAIDPAQLAADDEAAAMLLLT